MSGDYSVEIKARQRNLLNQWLADIVIGPIQEIILEYWYQDAHRLCQELKKLTEILSIPLEIDCKFLNKAPPPSGQFIKTPASLEAAMEPWYWQSWQFERTESSSNASALLKELLQLLMYEWPKLSSEPSWSQVVLISSTYESTLIIFSRPTLLKTCPRIGLNWEITQELDGDIPSLWLILDGSFFLLCG
jgi:hypothetical protein